MKLKYILTDTSDGSKEELEKIHADYALVKKEDFSHSLTREKYILESDADICILLTQDARLVNNDVYQTLVDAMVGDVEYAYLRQVNTNRSVERYTRMFNYPKESRITLLQRNRRLWQRFANQWGYVSGLPGHHEW